MLNKHIIEAIQRTVDEDQGNVVIVSKKPLATMKQLVESLDGITEIRWVNGNESIKIDNGSWIRVIGFSGHGRGLTANLLIIPVTLSQEERETLLPALVPTQGEVLGYL